MNNDKIGPWTIEQAERYMRAAIDVCRAGMKAGNTPFGAAIVTPDGRVIAAHNTVWQTTDITAHAEVTCIRTACRELNTVDLSGCWIFSTTEPCPMCAAACHWSRFAGVVFGATIADAAKAGFHELPIACDTMLQDSETQVYSGVFAEECAALFEEWRKTTGAQVY
ncbi:MAG: nucleoside deaminase [Phycisphaerae bacterium]